MANERLLRFYRSEGADDRGRRIEGIWRFSFDELEGVHDYIQWLFPLADRSAFNPGAPLLDGPTIAQFRDEKLLRTNVHRSLDVMLDFYGLAIDSEYIGPGLRFNERAENWLTPGNHNFLRLTRILKSLSLLGHEMRAAMLLACLEDIYRGAHKTIGERTIRYWREAFSS